MSQSHVQLLGHELRARRNQILLSAPLPISCMTLNKLLSFTACVYGQCPVILRFIICDTPFYTVKYFLSRNVTLVWVPVASGPTDWVCIIPCSKMVPSLSWCWWRMEGGYQCSAAPALCPAWQELPLGLGSLGFSHLQIRSDRNHLLHEKLGGGKYKWH